MRREKPVEVLFFRTVSQREPVREFLKDLSIAEKKIIGADIRAVQWLWPCGKPLVDSLGDGIYELRSTLPNRICRVLFFQRDDGLVLLHAFIKKTRKCPPDDLGIAEKRMKEFKANEEK